MAIIGAILLGTLLASLTDWLFFDLLVHRYYRTAPEIWRPGGTPRIVLSQIIGTPATAAAVLLYALAPGHPWQTAALAWAAGSLPIALQDLQWLRPHQAVAASHALGWFVRLLIATVSAAWLLPP